MTVYNSASEAKLGITENFYVPYEITDTWTVEDRIGPNLQSARFFSMHNIVPDTVTVELTAKELQALGKTGLSNLLMQYDMEDGSYPPGVEFARKIEKLDLDGISMHPHSITVANIKPEKCIPALAAFYGNLMPFGVSPKKVIPIEADLGRNSYGRIFGYGF